MHRAVNLPNRVSLTALLRELGPLRPIAGYVAVASLVGSLGLVAALPCVARWLGDDAAGVLLATLAIAVAIAGAFAIPSVLGFAAGWCCGGVPGGVAAVAGGAFGAVLGQRLVWARLDAARLAWMRERPRALLVRRLCGDGALGVARLRWASRWPNAVVNLLFAVNGVPARHVLPGSALGALPAAALAAGLGAAWRRWRESGAVPSAGAWCAAAGAALLTAWLAVWSRRAVRAAADHPIT